MNLKPIIPALDKRGLREFGLVTGSLVAGIFGLVLPWLLSLAFPLWPWILAAILATWALAHPNSLKPVYVGWMFVGHIMGLIMNPLVLGVVFFLVFTPLGVLMRLFGKNPMTRTAKFSASYRVQSNGPKPDNMDKPF